MVMYQFGSSRNYADGPTSLPSNSNDPNLDWGPSAQDVVDRYLADVRLIRAAAAEYGVWVLFVWQPIINYKESLTDGEMGIIDQTEQDMPGFFEQYLEVDALLRQRVSEENFTDFLVLSDLFSNDTRPLFYDKVHITENGNYTVARAILPEILKRLFPQ